jgi:hypothetical protein
MEPHALITSPLLLTLTWEQFLLLTTKRVLSHEEGPGGWISEEIFFSFWKGCPENPHYAPSLSWL